MAPRYLHLLLVCAAAPTLSLSLGPKVAARPAGRSSVSLSPPPPIPDSRCLSTGDPVAARAAAAGLALLPAAALATGVLEDPTGISAAFAFVTFVPQNFWLLLVFAPNWKFTRKVFEPLWPLCIVALFHLFIVVQSAGKPPEAGTAPIELFNNLFNPAIVAERGLDVYVELGTYPNFAAEEWTHELVWDLFVGRWIWLEGRRRDIFTSHSVLLTNLIGPPGLLLHCITVQLYAFFRGDQPDARWADPEPLRTELEAKSAAAARE